MKSAYILSARRTPIGSFQGSLSAVSGPQLGAIAAKAAIADAGLSADLYKEANIGCVLSAGVGQAPARQVVIFSGLPKSVRAMTVNKVCGSGLKAVTLAADRIAAERVDLILAGGIENMSQTPYYLKTARAGFRMGNQEATDGMIHDGLWDVYNQFHMGTAAEKCVKEYKFTREQQDAFATRSYQRAMSAIEKGLFAPEIAKVSIASKKETIEVSVDEEPGRGKVEKFSSLRPAFDPSGTITAANASSINDGAAMLVIASEEIAKKAKPIARIIHQAEYAHEPEWFTTAPVSAVRNLLKEAQVKVSDVASFEVNEAFAVVAMAAEKELQISSDKMNPRGGAVALGHPIGASGARILTTLLYTLKPKELGVATLCIGGGEGIAVLVERL